MKKTNLLSNKAAKYVPPTTSTKSRVGESIKELTRRKELNLLGTQHQPQPMTIPTNIKESNLLTTTTPTTSTILEVKRRKLVNDRLNLELLVL